MIKACLNTKLNGAIESAIGEQLSIYQLENDLGEEAADSPLHPLQDLRYGGEDLSGISEWSMRAHSPSYDDGLTAGDFQRSDNEIMDAVWESLDLLGDNVRGLEICVCAAEVFIQGKVDSIEKRDALIDTIVSVPGVKNVFDGLFIHLNQG